ncbi:MAG: isoprenyl transferase [Candidatus Omnitrophica bacterium]|nr:isoprenyl transferase [Candidatus Omnitrophota bacterium]
MPNIPTHIAIIMDGNRRWARRHGLPATFGHGEGVKAIERVIKAAPEMGVKILTLHAFSTENWKRPSKEIKILLELLERYLDSQKKRLMDNGIRLNTIGRVDRFPAKLREKLNEVKNLTKRNSRLVLNLALNYGGRNEIVEAARQIVKDAKKGKLKTEAISEESFSKYLYTSGMPDPDLLIRTSGELRLSNFLLWQASYAEIYITKKLWPDFGKADLRKAIDSYQKRKRRLGG